MAKRKLVEFTFEGRDGRRITGVIHEEFPSVTGVPVADAIETEGEPVSECPGILPVRGRRNSGVLALVTARASRAS